MNMQTQYILRAPNGDQLAECDLKGSELFATSEADRAAVAALSIGESYTLVDEVGTFRLERIA